MTTIELEKSKFYKNGYPQEEVFFGVREDGAYYALGNGQDTYGRSRDDYNLVNIISETNDSAQEAYENFDATVFSTNAEAMEKINEYLLKTIHKYDEKKTSSELEEFLKTEKLSQASWNFDTCLSVIKDVITRGIEGMPEDTRQHSHEYIRDVINEAINPTGKDITSINGRRALSDKILGRKGIDEYTERFFSNLSYSIEKLEGTPYMDNISKLFEDGFPKLVDIKEQKVNNEEQRAKIYSSFPHKREDALRTLLFKQYTSEHIKGAMQLKYYEETKDLSIFLTAKEQEEFNSMSFEELKEKYGTKLVTTHKGAVLSTLKLHQEKEEGKDLKASLESYNELITCAKSEANFDMNIRRYIFNEIKKDYQKFATHDMDYRNIVANLAPSGAEQGAVKSLIEYHQEQAQKLGARQGVDKALLAAATQNSNVIHLLKIERLKKIKNMQDSFVHDSAPIITGKANKSDIENAKARITNKKKEETISQAINRVKKQHQEDRKTGENLSGVIIADDIAERLREGFEITKEKREVVATNLRRKRASIEK